MAAALRAIGLPSWPGWRHLPRDSRDTLFLVAVVGWTVLPHASHLPPWCIALTALMLAWRAHLALASRPLPNRWAVITVLAVATALTLWTEGTLFGKDAGVTMLVVLVALKTLELRARRDALVVFLLGFFVVLTQFLYEQSLLLALAMLLSVWGLLTALVLAHMPVGTPPLKRAGGIAARAALLGLPLMVALFLLFPRIGPLWGAPGGAVGKTGLSGTMRLGGVAGLALDDSVALRVRFFGLPPPQQALYFRGPVLSVFDGREWSRSGTPADRLQPPEEVELRGAPLRYEMTLEPSRLAMLPLLELTPARADAAPRIEGLAATRRGDGQWETSTPVVERLRFEAAAWPAFRRGPFAPDPALAPNLLLPAGYNPRTLQWAHALRQDPAHAGADARALAAAVLAHIGSGGYTYTLEPGDYGRDAIDEFWLDRKLGFCEHFAAAFVVVMRALGVPARVVTGYQGADAAPVDDYWTVRQSNAHAWAEYWQPGEGWLRIDPTAAVAPDRILRGRSLAPRPGLVAGAIGTVSPQLLAQLRQFAELVDNRWNQWVLNYSRAQQFGLLEDLGIEAPGWNDLVGALVGLLCATSLAVAGWALWDRHRQDPWQRLQQRVAARLTQLQVTVAAHEPPRTRALRVRAALGAAGEPLARTLEALDAARYGGRGPRPRERDWWRRIDAAATAVQRQ